MLTRSEWSSREWKSDELMEVTTGRPSANEELHTLAENNPLTMCGTEDEDPAGPFDSHKVARECLDPLVDTAGTEEATKAKLKELHQLVEFALGKKRVTTRWDLDHRKDGIIARFVAREFKGDETVYDMFAPSSTPSTGRVIDNFEPQEGYITHSQHT